MIAPRSAIENRPLLALGEEPVGRLVEGVSGGDDRRQFVIGERTVEHHEAEVVELCDLLGGQPARRAATVGPLEPVVPRVQFDVGRGSHAGDARPGGRPGRRRGSRSSAVGVGRRPRSGVADEHCPLVVEQFGDLVGGVEEVRHLRPVGGGVEVVGMVRDDLQRAAGSDDGDAPAEQGGAIDLGEVHELQRHEVVRTRRKFVGQHVGAPPGDPVRHAVPAGGRFVAATLERDTGDVERVDHPAAFGEPDRVGALAGTDVEGPTGRQLSGVGHELRVGFAAPDAIGGS